MMGRIKILTFLVTLSLLTFFSRNVQGQDILRIHIIANSNSPQDQFVKYQVRDEIINKYSKEIARINGQKELDKFVNDNIEDIVNISISVLEENGYDYAAQGEVGNFDFPTRLYMDTVYPGGNYKAVRVILGEGAGDNWWCVMFPPLCFVGEVKDVEQSQGDSIVKAQELEVEYDFIVVKWFKGISGFFRNLL